MLTYCDKPEEEDSTVVTLLKEAGAIIIARGNVPQGMLTFNTDNDVWGRGKNPWDTQRTVGGSSGGDAGMVAARCVPLGMGCDLGGSIRIPSCFNGIYGFKPTSCRVSFKGLKLPIESQVET